MKRAIKNKIKAIYYDIAHPASYGSVNSLLKYAKKIDKDIKRVDIESFLAEERSYTLHKPAPKKFKTRKILSRHINHIWQIDLIVLNQIQRENDGAQYILVAIDVFSRKAYAVPMKLKNAKSSLKAFKKIVAKSKETPLKIHSDKGSEFWNKSFRDYLKQKNILMYTTENENKASIVERYIRSLKSKMFKYFSANKTLRYVGILDGLVKSLNNRHHRVIGTFPNDVTKANQKEIYDRQYGPYLSEKYKDYKFKLGDRVRISRKKNMFEKGYIQNFTDELFTVIDQLPTNPRTYKIIDDNNELIVGSFYEKELALVVSS